MPSNKTCRAQLRHTADLRCYASFYLPNIRKFSGLHALHGASSRRGPGPPHSSSCKDASIFDKNCIPHKDTAGAQFAVVSCAPMGKQLFKDTCTGFVLLAITICMTVVHNKAETPSKRWDYQAFYMGAQMVAHGEGSRLYDLPAQAAAQNQYVDPSRNVKLPDRPFIYPPAILALFLPFAWLPMGYAYGCWTAFNLLTFMVAVRMLQKASLGQANAWLWLPLILFTPVYVCLMKGQASILVLFLVAGAFYFLLRDRLLLAGFLVGLATLKFQLVLGLLIILALRRMWSVVAGAIVGVCSVISASLLLSGWRAMLAYPGFLKQVAYHDRVAYTFVVINLRGMLWFIGHQEPNVWLVAVLSAAMLITAAVAWPDDATGFALAVLASLLTSYHAHFEELGLLLIPATVLMGKVRWNLGSLAVVGFIFLGGYLALVANLDTFFALFCDIAFICALWQTRTGRSTRAATAVDTA